LSSIFSLPAYIGPYFIYILMGVSIALILSFTLTWMLVVRGDKNAESQNPKIIASQDSH